ncbi:MAG: hypothetical protein ACRET7_02145 [Burkholderiales bacterium]
MIEQQPGGAGFESSGEILVVDDTPESRLLIGALLMEAGYRVREAEDGTAARSRPTASTSSRHR